jgi:hypothetical protein
VDGARTVSHEKKKFEDAQMPLISNIFEEWKVRQGIAW